VKCATRISLFPRLAAAFAGSDHQASSWSASNSKKLSQSLAWHVIAEPGTAELREVQHALYLGKVTLRYEAPAETAQAALWSASEIGMKPP